MPDIDTSVRAGSISEEFPKRKVNIRTQLDPVVAHGLIQFLKENYKAFACSYADMPGISRDVIKHELAIKPSALPVKQKR